MILKRADARQKNQFEHDKNVVIEMQKAIAELRQATAGITSIAGSQAQSLKELSSNVVDFTKTTQDRSNKSDQNFGRFVETSIKLHKNVFARVNKVESEIQEVKTIWKFIKTKLNGRVD